MTALRPALALAGSLAAAAFIGYQDGHTDDTGIIAGLIVLSSFFAAIIEPRWAWCWALIIGLAVPVAERRPMLAPATLAFALAGAYSWWLFHKFALSAAR